MSMILHTGGIAHTLEKRVPPYGRKNTFLNGEEYDMFTVIG